MQIDETVLRTEAVYEGDNSILVPDDRGELLFYVRHAFTANQWCELPKEGHDAKDATLYRFVITDLVHWLFQLDMVLDPESDELEIDDIGEIAYDDGLYRVYIVAYDDFDSYQFYAMQNGHPISIDNNCSVLNNLAQNVADRVGDELQEVVKLKQDPEQLAGTNPVDFLSPIWPEPEELNLSWTDRRLPI